VIGFGNIGANTSLGEAGQTLGISVLMLQKRLPRFSTEHLNAPMEQGWHRNYDKQKFCAPSIFDGAGAVFGDWVAFQNTESLHCRDDVAFMY